MFTPKTEIPKTKLDETIDLLHFEMRAPKGDSDEYSAMVANLAKLYDIKKSLEKDNKKIVSMDQVIAVAGNLAGILMILNFERAHVVTSKALSFVIKSKA